jgi:iron(III) transport system substrate-binding protein
VAALALCLSVAACGGGGSDPASSTDAGSAAEAFERFNAMSGQERHDALVEAAQEEGKVVLYTAESNMESVTNAFEEQYGIAVEMYAGQSDTVMQRLLQEAQAGHSAVDVLEDSEAYTVAEQGLTHEYVNRELTPDLPGYDPDSHVAPTRLSVYTQGWNTDLVSEQEIPDTLDGFTDPKWDGKLSIDPRDWVW